MSVSDWRGRTIVLGVTGSIAAYKAVSLLREMTKRGANVTVVMTAAARRFVGALTFETLSRNSVPDDLLADTKEMTHIAMAKRADCIVVAPATASLIARMAQGLGDDVLSVLLLSSTKPVIVAPAMDGGMWEHPATQHNVATLRSRGVTIVEPFEGELASGLTGVGRLAPESEILSAAESVLFREADLRDETILVTAGPTREYLDPVRYISNPSSGRMGFELAKSARRRGARVILVTGPTHLAAPDGVETLHVETVDQMHDEVMRQLPRATVVLMAAAVGDFSPVHTRAEKMKKDSAELWRVELRRTPDILSEVGLHKGGRIIVGFAAETERVIDNAMEKLRKKNLDLIVANDITRQGAGFGGEHNEVMLIDGSENIEHILLDTKESVAEQILERVNRIRRERCSR